MAAAKYIVEHVKHSLEIEERVDLHEISWVAQRIGWILIFVFIALAALGLFGEGPLSKKKMEFGGASIQYERFFRHEARMELTVDINNAIGGQSVISFPNQYLKNFRIESILPEPKENKIQNGMILYVFEGAEPLNVIFYFISQEYGNIHGTVHVNNQSFHLSHFIYP